MNYEFRQKLIFRMIDACGKESVEVKDFARVCELFPEDEIHDRILTEVVKNYEKKKNQRYNWNCKLREIQKRIFFK